MDLLLRGAMVADGSRRPLRRADVGVAGGRVTQVGDLRRETAARVVDLDGLVLAPGFIDAHTHYDAQVLWDPDLTPTCWHGVTTVLVGNCGFGIAPLKPEQRETIALTLENVEGMSADVLAAGIPWSFETFPEYLAALDRAPKRLNVVALIGHTPVRMFVLGDEASDREATSEEIADMRTVVLEGLRHGALGFSTSKSVNHQGVGGRPVPSRLASWDELRALAGALSEAGHGILQATPGPGLALEELARLSTETGRPVTWTALFTGLGTELLASANVRGTAIELLERSKGLGGEVWPQIASLPQVMQITLADPFPFGMLPSFKEVLAAPREERAQVYRQQGWRERAREELPPRWRDRWRKTTIDESERHVELRHGPTLAELAADRGVDPFDLLVDLSLEEELATRFRVVLGNDDDAELEVLLRDATCVLAVSDGGAHVSQICDARYPTHFLRHWVRERQAVPLTEAIWRLTGHVAEVFRIPDRGFVRPGFAADLVAFDPDRVGDLEPYRVWDLPAGGDRLVAGSTGLAAVWVNGDLVHRDGTDVDVRPGRLLRSGPQSGHASFESGRVPQ